MDVLFVGLSPELIATEAFPVHLATVRAGGNLPGDPWDAVFVRFNALKAETLPRTFERALSTLRHGGQLALVAQDRTVSSDRLIESLSAFGDVEVHGAADGSRAAIIRRFVPGRQDLVGLRRCQSRLSGHLERLEALCADVRERDAARRPLDSRSIKEMVGHFGDVDRDGHLACIAGILAESAVATPVDFEALMAERDHNGRPLAELVTRVRHFRYQSLEVLQKLEEEDWLKTGPAPDGRQGTIAEIVRSWVRWEADRLEELGERLA